jgi:hypothetical protein
VPSSERDKRLRAELAAELGWHPADLDDESIARHRADAARKKTDHDPAKKWAHLTELARQRDVEAKGRAEVADLLRVDRGPAARRRRLRRGRVWPLPQQDARFRRAASRSLGSITLMSSRVYVPHTKVRDIPAGPVSNKTTFEGLKSSVGDARRYDGHRRPA